MSRTTPCFTKNKGRSTHEKALLHASFLLVTLSWCSLGKNEKPNIQADEPNTAGEAGGLSVSNCLALFAMQISYTSMASNQGVYAFWKSYAWSYMEPALDAASSISRCDGKNSTIREIAREAAAEVNMRLNE